jgi:hypothetical protein
MCTKNQQNTLNSTNVFLWYFHLYVSAGNPDIFSVKNWRCPDYMKHETHRFHFYIVTSLRLLLKKFSFMFQVHLTRGLRQTMNSVYLVQCSGDKESWQSSETARSCPRTSITLKSWKQLLVVMFAPWISSIKHTFIVPTDAHYYKNHRMWKQILKL